MLVPADTSKMDYGSLFEFTATSALDNSSVAAEAKVPEVVAEDSEEEKKRILEDDEEEDEWALEGDTNAARDTMKFSWELIKHEPRQI
jgi:hypothetical protein